MCTPDQSHHTLKRSNPERTLSITVTITTAKFGTVLSNGTQPTCILQCTLMLALATHASDPLSTLTPPGGGARGRRAGRP